jgi:hypothetical protein
MRALLLRREFDLVDRPELFPVIGNEVPPFSAQTVKAAAFHRSLQNFQIQRYLRVGAVVSKASCGREFIEVCRHRQLVSVGVDQRGVDRHAPGMQGAAAVGRISDERRVPEELPQLSLRERGPVGVPDFQSKVMQLKISLRRDQALGNAGPNECRHIRRVQRPEGGVFRTGIAEFDQNSWIYFLDVDQWLITDRKRSGDRIGVQGRCHATTKENSDEAKERDEFQWKIAEQIA